MNLRWLLAEQKRTEDDTVLPGHLGRLFRVRSVGWEAKIIPKTLN